METICDCSSSPTSKERSRWASRTAAAGESADEGSLKWWQTNKLASWEYSLIGLARSSRVRLRLSRVTCHANVTVPPPLSSTMLVQCEDLIGPRHSSLLTLMNLIPPRLSLSKCRILTWPTRSSLDLQPLLGLNLRRLILRST